MNDRSAVDPVGWTAPMGRSR